MLSSRLGCITSRRSVPLAISFFQLRPPSSFTYNQGDKISFSLSHSHARSGRGGGRRRPGQKAPAFAASEWEKGGKKKKNLNVFQPSFFSFFSKKPSHTHTTLPFDLPYTYTRQPDLFIHLTPSPLTPSAAGRSSAGPSERPTHLCAAPRIYVHTHIRCKREI